MVGLAVVLAARLRWFVLGGVENAPHSPVPLAEDALGVDPQQDGHAVPGPFRDLGWATPALSQVDTAAWLAAPSMR